MPSKPKIPKEDILKAALELLVQDGYESVNIKTVAEKLNCSTQPISWQFGNMEGFRKALTDYAVTYAGRKMVPKSENAFEAFTEVGAAYVGIAFDEPKLFQYLYMSANSGYSVGGLDALAAAENRELICGVAEVFGITPEMASGYVVNTIIYSTGILSLIVSGVLNCGRERAQEMIDRAGYAFLSQAGVDAAKAERFHNCLTGAGK